MAHIVIDPGWVAVSEYATGWIYLQSFMQFWFFFYLVVCVSSCMVMIVVLSRTCKVEHFKTTRSKSVETSTFCFTGLFVTLFLNISLLRSLWFLFHKNMWNSNQTRVRTLTSWSFNICHISLTPNPFHRLLSALVSSAIRFVFCMSPSSWLHSDNPIKSTSGKPVGPSHTQNEITVQLAIHLQSWSE